MKRSTVLSLIAVISCIMVPLASAGTWRDDFNDGNLDGWVLINPGPEEKWGVENGECSGQWTPAPVVMWSTQQLRVDNSFSWKDYTVVCKVKLVEKFGGGTWSLFGIVLRAVHSGQATYTASINPKSKEASLWILARQVLVVPFDILEDTWYKFKVIAEGNHFEFYINDELMGSFDDSSYPSGTIQLGVADVHVHFDDVVITGPDIPDGGPGSISVRQKDVLATMWGTLKQKQEGR